MHNKELVRLFKNRDRAGFEYLYSKYSDALYGYIIRVVNDRRVAEDLLQESFVKIWQDCAQFNLVESNLFSCMLRVTTRLLMEYSGQQGESLTETAQKIINANSTGVYATAG